MLPKGTYIIQLYTNGQEVNSQWEERCSGVMAWWNGETNSALSHEIPLSKAGHATNNHNIRLRILRQLRNNGGQIKLQITDSIAWTGLTEIQIRVRQLI